MTTQRIMELVNQELDAENSAAKSARLHRLLKKDPEAQAYFEDLKKLDGMLGRVKQLEPPVSLKAGILSAIRASARPARAKSSVVQSIISRLSSPALPRYGFAVASGICIGMFLFAFVTGGFEPAGPRDQVVGTMGAAPFTARTVTDYALFENASVKSSVQVATVGPRVFVEAEIEGSVSTELSLLFPPDAYSVVGIRRQAGILSSVHSGRGSISTVIEGSGRYVVELDRLGPASPPLQVTLIRQGSPAWERTMETGSPE